MSRLTKAIEMDVRVQWRNKLYAIGVGVAMVIGVALSQGVNPDQLSRAVPAVLLTLIGGSTMLYVAGLIIFEKDEGTLNALMTSPMKHHEYLWSKIITLTTLSTLESIVIVGVGTAILGKTQSWVVPNLALLLLGMVLMGIFYTLIGIILIVRFDKITDFLIPMSVIAIILQLPFLHFATIVEHPLFLVVPSSAPTMMIAAAYMPLSAWQWVYAIGYSVLTISGLLYWASRAFEKHIIMNVG